MWHRKADGCLSGESRGRTGDDWPMCTEPWPICLYANMQPAQNQRPTFADLTDLLCRLVGFLDFANSFCRLVSVSGALDEKNRCVRIQKYRKQVHT